MDRERDEQVRQLADMFAAVTPEVTLKPVTGFLAMKGHKYSGELMVVGRAVNGWADGRTAEELRTEEQRLAYAHEIYKSVNEGDDEDCPTSWVVKAWGAPKGEYNSARSAFWRVTRSVVSGLGIANVEEISWPSHIVWSNLYKIAPSDGGNPGDKLSDAQLSACQKLLQWEMDSYQPRRILFLTGWWADCFLEGFWAEEPKQAAESSLKVGRLRHAAGTAACVVAEHPQGKSEAPMVDSIVQAFQSH